MFSRNLSHGRIVVHLKRFKLVIIRVLLLDILWNAWKNVSHVAEAAYIRFLSQTSVCRCMEDVSDEALFFFSTLFIYGFSCLV